MMRTMMRRTVAWVVVAAVVAALGGGAAAQQLTPKQKILAGDTGFLGRLEVTLAVYATAGLQTYPATTGNTTNTSKVITGIPSTAGWVIGQQATIGGVPDQPSYITSVDSATQITVSEAAQATATGVSVTVKPFPATGVRATTYTYAKLVAANAATYALQWAPYIVGSTNVKDTVSFDAETGAVKTTATDAALMSQVITDFLARSL